MRFDFGLSWRALPLSWWEGGATGARGSWSAVREQREMNAGAQLAFSLKKKAQDSSLCMVLLTVRVGLPSSVKLLWKNS